MQQVTRKLLSVAVISAAVVVAGMGVASADSSGNPSTTPAQGQQPQTQAEQTQGKTTQPQGKAAQPKGQAAQPQGKAAQPQGKTAQPQGQAAQPQAQSQPKLLPQNLPTPLNQKGPLGLPVSSPLTSGLGL